MPRHLQVSVRLASVQGFLRLVGQANGCRFAKNYASVCDNNFSSLVTSLFSWRCLAASTSSFLHATMNLRPPSVIVSTRTPQPSLMPSLSNPLLSQRPGYRRVRNRSTISPSYPVLSALHPQGFRTRFAFLAVGRRTFPLAPPPPQKSSRPAASTRTTVRGVVRGRDRHMVSIFFTDTFNAKTRQTSLR